MSRKTIASTMLSMLCRIWHAPLIIALGVNLAACSSSQGVDRRRGDILQSGRSVPAAAYAWYTRGLHFERQNDLKSANYAFIKTLDSDPQSGAAWASLGRVQCKLNQTQALESFDEGLRKAERKAPIHVERGRCILRQPRERILLRAALADALNAIALEPQNALASALAVDCYNALGQQDTADRYTLAHSLYSESSNERESLTSSLTPGSLREIDRALIDGNLKGARTLALTTITPGQLATRAAAWGKYNLARQQAELVFESTPDDADAFVVLTILHKVTDATEATFEPPPIALGQLSNLGIVLFATHLGRHVGRDQALQFLAPFDESMETEGDKLTTSLLQRLKD